MIYKGNQFAKTKKKLEGSCTNCYFFENLSTMDCMITEACYDQRTETNYIWIKVYEISEEEKSSSYSI